MKSEYSKIRYTYDGLYRKEPPPEIYYCHFSYSYNGRIVFLRANVLLVTSYSLLVAGH